MRYSSAAVLSTIVVGQAAAANLHNRHASFHARRQAEVKRSAANEVDWSKVAYDLSDVDWSSVFATPTPTPAPAAAPKVAEVADYKTQAEPTPSSTKQEPTTTSAKPAATSAESNDPLGDLGDALDNVGDAIGGLVSSIFDDVQDWVEELGCKKGVNKQSQWDGIWVGGDSKWKAEFINDRSDQDMLLFCWRALGYSGMSVKANQPDISVKIPAGKSLELSWKEGVPSACAPVFPGYKDDGFQINNTWWEVTFGASGAFDVSRNINMNGDSISSKGSKCVSDMNTCVFKCKNGLDTCEQGSDYDLFNCNSSGGGGGGYDPIMAGTGGGCSMGQNGETVKVVIS
ncbi:uncharacterized protein J4E88_003942 [Alternaria novae-zelandiae]|uniref:uncharacterized protein n=1 Tax=Alternaria novae-zelandiae TaxID=430562 RepID=UPI0020C1FEC5|nr:uncharacterized protein J4E88_003942 [Alternaria novae-zelandiae]XP_051324809.1 uncharacterized protein J4E85_007503 [Alternaria conjuncta]XP_051351117.1 uncharacterized protein J4E92_007480 [Alternaria infectoria]KAI4698500.1 hypothetical protein J4E81_005723 [Alternaria sp. BMP 2799]KAI4686105.1 hypothetical protein J4E88_003942 [Alternaria novae-zelandiae]KAI4924399.1 hypothetical protein J4E92_007480 [Alternaria infectoria]KAI4925624.1 hypothetical protein J4E85_007503 [Alternaria conj